MNTNTTQNSISNWMTRKVVTVMADDTIQDTVNLMLEHRLTTVPVVGLRDECIGILSRSDLTESLVEEDSALAGLLDNERLSMTWLNRTLDTCDVRHVKELMTFDVVTINENQSLAEASQILVDKEIHHLPVVNEDARLVGMLSALDIVRSVAEEAKSA